MVLNGTLVVPDSKEIFLELHLSPPPESVNEVGFICKIYQVRCIYSTAIGNRDSMRSG
jgi:hypothetical protein